MHKLSVLLEWLRRMPLILALAVLGTIHAHAAAVSLAPDSAYWIDTSGKASIETVSALPEEQLQLQAGHQNFRLGQSALWMRIPVPALPQGKHWYLLLDGSSFTDSVQHYQATPQGGWRMEQAGDHIPVSQWSAPDRSPVFELAPSDLPRYTWLRLTNSPTPLSVRANLVDGDELQRERSWTFLLVGAYLGFGLLVLFLSLVHARLYADRVFPAYMAYVAAMLGFQAAYTGVGGFFFWPDSARWNDAAPAVFMLWLTGAGIWFVREACAISRYRPGLDRFVLGWSVFGLLYPALYLTLHNDLAFAILNAYGLLSVFLSAGLCIWAWRQGDRYAGWLFLGFLPVHLSYPFPALRTAGLMPDTWAAQYAVLIGSAIEIPLLLYILHRRAKEFNENRARMRALNSADPLTGLPIKPILHLRLQDAVRRSRRFRHQSGLLLVELANHADLRLRMGQETSDRALVVAAARLSRVVRDVDTVCRVTHNRFAILVEGPSRLEHIKLLSQHIVAKGLEPGSTLPDDTSLRFRVVTSLLPPAREMATEMDESDEAKQLLVMLSDALNHRSDDPRRMVVHLDEPALEKLRAIPEPAA